METGRGRYSVEKIIRRGAEADIVISSWFGQRVIVKRRVSKLYRHPKLDKELRSKRTVHEAVLLAESRGIGVPTPVVFFVDPNSGELVIQHVEGIRLKEVLSNGDEDSIQRHSTEAGRYIGTLHANSIIHGDLTTSNLIVSKDGRLILIDFGLSFHSTRDEDRAVDLHLIKQVLTSGHTERAETVFRFIMRGYGEVMKEKASERIGAKIVEIEKRGRYTHAD